ncbi:YIP1 family protein [Azotosporobacter soli]|uniref:YIP1 family protein n=1 Tax=Azotosporobacter soli TaxID=3055040 RepID=UPI0031FF359E
MYSQWEVIYDVIFAPRAGMLKAASCVSPLRATLFVVGGYLTGSVLFSLPWQQTQENMNGERGLVIAAVLLSVSCWLVSVALWHLAAELVGGKGRAKALLAASGCAHLPLFFQLLPAAALLLFPSNGVAAVLAFLAIVAWKIWLDVEAIAAVYGFARSKAVLVLLMPWLMLGVALLLVLIAVSIEMIWEGGMI